VPRESGPGISSNTVGSYFVKGVLLLKLNGEPAGTRRARTSRNGNATPLPFLTPKGIGRGGRGEGQRQIGVNEEGKHSPSAIETPLGVGVRAGDL